MTRFPLSTLTRCTLALIVVAAAATLGFMLYAGRPWKQGMGTSLRFLLFAALALGPAWILWRMARINDRHRPGSLVVAAGAAIILLSANVLYALVLFVDEPDAQAGLVFVFLPILQYLAVSLTQLAVAIARRLSPPAGGAVA